MLIWSMGFPANERLLLVSDPATLAAARMGTAGLFLLAVWALLEGPAALGSAKWPTGLFIGGVGFGFGSITMLWAQRLTDATTVAVVSSMLPIVGLLFETVFDGRRITLKLALGILLSIAGGILAIATGIGQMQIGLGAAVSLLSVVGFAWGSRATVASLPDMTPLGRTALTGAGAGIATATVALALHVAGQGWARPEILSPFHVSLILFAGIASFALSQLLWIVSTERLGVGIGGMHINATPFYVMLFVWALGGQWSWLQVLAAAVVVAGVIVAQLPDRGP
jgi:drug/metabolite transporter (DMT)-like permease